MIEYWCNLKAGYRENYRLPVGGVTIPNEGYKSVYTNLYFLAEQCSIWIIVNLGGICVKCNWTLRIWPYLSNFNECDGDLFHSRVKYLSLEDFALFY